MSSTWWTGQLLTDCCTQRSRAHRHCQQQPARTAESLKPAIEPMANRPAHALQWWCMCLHVLSWLAASFCYTGKKGTKRWPLPTHSFMHSTKQMRVEQHCTM